MSTIISHAVCHGCKAPVAVVRRTVEQPCEYRYYTESETHPGREECRAETHTHAIADVAWTVVNADGERHQCPA